jgi:hypothetical protein
VAQRTRRGGRQAGAGRFQVTDRRYNDAPKPRWSVMAEVKEVKYFGEYERNTVDAEECLTLKFSASSRPLKDRWRNNGLSADFLGDYFTTFLPTEKYPPDSVAVKLAVSHIANELLENAMKFCNHEKLSSVLLHIDLNSSNIRFRLINKASEEQLILLRRFINKFLHTDPTELFVLQMEENMENETGSGIGFLSMVNDYNAKVGWGVQQYDKSNYIISTQVKLPL